MSLIKVAVVNSQQMTLQRRMFTDPNQGPHVASLYDRFTSAVAESKQTGDLTKMRLLGKQLKSAGVQRAIPVVNQVTKAPGLISRLKPLQLLKKAI